MSGIAGIEIRIMMPKKIPAVLEIDDKCYTHQSDNWTEQGLRDFVSFKNKIPNAKKGSYVVVSVDSQGRELEVLAYFMILIENHRILILDVIVADGHRKKGLGKLIVRWLKKKSDELSKPLALLLPLSRKDEVEYYFCSRGIQIITAKIKGKNDLDPVIVPMGMHDATRVQQYDVNYLEGCMMQKREIEAMISRQTRYGVAAYNAAGSGELVAYAIYALGNTCFELEGDFPLVVCSQYQRRGVGTNLMAHLASLAMQRGMSLRISGMTFAHSSQYDFLAVAGFSTSDLVSQGWVIYKPHPVIIDP